MKLKHDKLLSNFAVNCKLRHYTLGGTTPAAGPTSPEMEEAMVNPISMAIVKFVAVPYGQHVLTL